MLQAASYEAIAQPALNVWDTLKSMPGTEQGLAPMLVDPGVKKSAKNGSEIVKDPRFTTTHITLGARGDSYYEYMLKQYLVGGKKDKKLLDMYTESMRGVRDLLLRETKPCVSPPTHARLNHQSDSRSKLPGRISVLDCISEMLTL